jgi:hypothetical protein
MNAGVFLMRTLRLLPPRVIRKSHDGRLGDAEDRRQEERGF